MRPLVRKQTDKGREARAFSHKVNRTKVVNVSPNPMRGGIRL